MGISYAGQALLLEDRRGKVQNFLDNYLPFCDAPLFSEYTPTDIAGQTDSLAGAQGQKAFVNLPKFNYTPPPRPRINTLWWPTGATRWARGCFLTDDSGLKAIQTTNQNPAPLILSDGTNTLTFPAMHLLPPRQVTIPGQSTASSDGANRLWVLPLVDGRYFWQFFPTSESFTAAGQAWSDLITTLDAILDGTLPTLGNDTVAAAYLNPDPTELTRPGFPVSLLLDAIAASIGMRLVYNPIAYTPTLKFQGFAGAKSTLADNLGPITNQLMGGDWSLVKGFNGSIPSSLTVSFPNYAQHHFYSDGSVYFTGGYTAATYLDPALLAAAPSNLSVAGTKFVRSTCYADFSNNIGAGTPNNDTELDDLAVQIATDYYGWFTKQYDRSFPGIVPWNPGGFDDFVEWSAGRRLPGGNYQCITRVASMPYNFGVEGQLSQDSALTIFNDHLPLKTRTAMAKGAAGPCWIMTGDPSGGGLVQSTTGVTAWVRTSNLDKNKNADAIWMGTWWNIINGDCPT